MPIKSAAAHTLGCKVNQYDTDALLEKLSSQGAAIVDFRCPADLYIINTCTVTQIGDRKSRQMIRRARRLNPRAFVAVCGCAAKMDSDGMREAGADFVFDARKPDLLLEKLCETPVPGSGVGICIDRQYAAADNFRRTRSFIKVQDGCDRFCTYCVIPYSRGTVTSRSPAEIYRETAECVKRGVKEAVLTGIHMASYGKDLDGISLSALIRNAAESGLERVRLGSIEPYAVDCGFLSAVAESPAVCGHFHLSLQSGCDRTLRRMNRRYTTREYAEAAVRLRAVRPDAAITTDIIVGFPGESDEDFQESMDFVSAMGFAQAHVFEYSPRAGTPAAEFPGQIPAAVKDERGLRMRALTTALARKFLTSHLGRSMAVLFETETADGFWEGHTGNYITVRAQSESALFNRIVDVRMETAGADYINGVIGGTHAKR